MALAALRAGKHVLVEKPLTLERAELAEIEAFYATSGPDATPILLTGFNRRFSDYGVRLADLVRGRTNPLMLVYRMNAGHIPLDHWVHGPEGGGRNLGEACHIYDLFGFLVGSVPVTVSAQPIRPTTDYYSSTDNFVATIAFEDGSVATLAYTALGSAAQSKERLDAYFDGTVAWLDDYRELVIGGSPKLELTSSASEKGQRQELEALVRAIRDGGRWPIPLAEQVQATRIAFEVQDQIERPS
jgi:predicted dehydrogenase